MVIRKPLARDVTRLRVIHRQRVLRQGDAEPAPASEGPLVAPHLTAVARAGWQRLVDTEYESVVIASYMTAGLARLGAPLDILGAFGRIVEDELRHVDLCAQLVDRLGDAPTIAPGAVPPVPIAVEGAAAAEVEFELIAGLCGFFCVFEHLSAHVFREALDVAQHPVARWALGEIHRDEAFHGAFGFETAKVFVPAWTDAQRARLGARLADDIRRFERQIATARAPTASDDERQLAAFGLLASSHLRAVVARAIQTELLPRLDDLGVRLPELP